MRMLALLSCAFLAAGCTLFAPAPERPWIAVRTAAFELYTDLGREDAIRLTDDLELYRAVLARSTTARRRTPRVPTKIFAFARRSDLRGVSSRGDDRGYMISSLSGNFGAYRPLNDAHARETLLHEYTHAVTATENAIVYPAWFTEGIAEMLSTIKIEGDHVLLGDAPSSAACLWAQGPSLAEIVASPRRGDWEGRPECRFYARSWLLLHYLSIGKVYAEKRAAEAFASRMDRYLRETAAGAPPGPAFAAAFELDLESLDDTLDDYVKRGTISVMQIRRGALAPETAREIRTPSYGEIATELGWLAFAGRKYRVARSFFEDAVQREPLRARTYVGLTAVDAIEGRIDEAAAHAQRALELERDGVEPLLAHALSARLLALARPGDAASLLAAARADLARAIERAPALAEPWVHLALVDLAAGQAAQGLEAARRAEKRLPADFTVQVTLARLLYANGRAAEASALVERLRYVGHLPPGVELEALFAGLEEKLREEQP
jgi:tetratricopeptide (TPR) repeat protein